MSGTLYLSSAEQAELAPAGRLRAGINYGNVVLANRDPASGELRGFHVDIARELGRRAGLAVELAGYAAAGAMVEALKAGALEVGLLSFEPARSGELDFTPVYLEVDATYLVPPGSPLNAAAEVDREGTRVAIAAASVYEHYLKRNLKHATLIGAPSTHEAFELFAARRLDALVGLRPRLVADSKLMPGSRVLDGRFMAVGQALASRKGHDAGARYLSRFIEDAMASGLVAGLLEKHGVRGVSAILPGRAKPE